MFDGLQASAGKGGCETRVRGLLGNKRASKFLLNLEEPEAGRAKKGQVQILPEFCQTCRVNGVSGSVSPL